MVIFLLTVISVGLTQSSVQASKAWVTGTVNSVITLEGDYKGGSPSDLRWEDDDRYLLDGDEDSPHYIDLEVFTKVYETPYDSYRVKIAIDENDWVYPPSVRLYAWVWNPSGWDLLAIITTDDHSATYTLDSDNYWEDDPYVCTWIRFTTDAGLDGYDLSIDTAVIQAWDDVM